MHVSKNPGWAVRVAGNAIISMEGSRCWLLDNIPGSGKSSFRVLNNDCQCSLLKMIGNCLGE